MFPPGCVKHTRLAQRETRMQVKLSLGTLAPPLPFPAFFSLPEKVGAFVLELTHAKGIRECKGSAFPGCQDNV